MNKEKNVHSFALSTIRGELLEREREKKRKKEREIEIERETEKEREKKRDRERERATNNIKCDKKRWTK